MSTVSTVSTVFTLQEFRAKLMMPLSQLALQTISVVMDEAPATPAALVPEGSRRAAGAHCAAHCCSAHAHPASSHGTGPACVCLFSAARCPTSS